MFTLPFLCFVDQLRGTDWWMRCVLLGKSEYEYLPFCLQDRTRKDFVRGYVKDLARAAIENYDRQAALQQVWPQVLAELVHSAVRDMWDSSAYAKRCLQQIEKSAAS